MTLRLRLLDTLFEIRAGDPAAGALLGLLWEPFLSGEDGPADVTFAIARDGDALTLSEEDADVPVIRHADVWGLADALRYRMLELTEAGLRRAVTLHAAAVARDGRVLLLAGPSGAGKTTLTLGLIRAEWTYFGDDVAPIDRATAEILPFPKPLGVKDAALFDEVASLYTGTGVPRPSHAFLVPAAGFRVASGPLPAAALAFPSYSAGAPVAVTRLSPARATALATPFVRRLEPDVLALLRRVCGACECFDLVYGSTAAGVEAATAVLGGAPLRRTT